MAVDLFSGTPGSGKSLLATYQGIEALETAKNVIANFPFDLSYFHGPFHRQKGKFLYVPTKDMTPEYFLRYAAENHVRKGPKAKKAQTLVLIDEAETKFNPRAWKEESRLDWIYFFANHRHFNYDFILICPNDRMLDRQIRAIIQTEYKCRCISGFGYLGKAINKVFGGLFASVSYNHAIQEKFFLPHFYKLHKRKARVYDTMALFEGMIGYDIFQQIEKPSETGGGSSSDTVLVPDNGTKRKGRPRIRFSLAFLRRFWCRLHFRWHRRRGGSHRRDGTRPIRADFSEPR